MGHIGPHSLYFLVYSRCVLLIKMSDDKILLQRTLPKISPFHFARHRDFFFYQGFILAASQFLSHQFSFRQVLNLRTSNDYATVSGSWFAFSITNKSHFPNPTEHWNLLKNMAKRTLSQTMALVEEMLQPSDDSSWEELLEPYVPFPQDTVKKKKKNERARCRRSKRLSPRRHLRPIKYSI